MLLVAVLAVVVIALLYVAERIRRSAVERHRHRVAERRLQTVMRDTEQRLELERRKREQAAALTSVVPAIQKPGTRHVP